jgi:pyridoxal phosphate enzyme (YggS family)
MSRYEKAWQAVAARVSAAAKGAGRTPESVAILAVSKTFPAEAVREVYVLGQRAFGENYVREGEAKRDALGDLPGLRLVLIGPLQSNKAARAARVFDAVETIDRPDIARKLAAARAALDGVPALDVLVQVNVSGEAQKHGVAPGAALALAREVAHLPALRLRGFMGIAAAGAGDAGVRAQFRTLKACFDAARRDGLAVDTLSMGMSGDLEAAIAEGATEVRIGSAIFGARAAAPAAAEALP